MLEQEDCDMLVFLPLLAQEILWLHKNPESVIITLLLLLGKSIHSSSLNFHAAETIQSSGYFMIATQPSDSTTTLKVNHLEWGPKQWKKGDQRKQTQSLCVC